MLNFFCHFKEFYLPSAAAFGPVFEDGVPPDPRVQEKSTPDVPAATLVHPLKLSVSKLVLYSSEKIKQM